MRHVGYLIAVLAAAAAPWLSPEPSASEASSDLAFPGWPSQIDGRPVTLVPLSEDERPFAEAFPGEVARLSDGERHHILRWIREPTRRLHPSSHCLRASGYTLTPEHLCMEEGGPAVCYRARRDDVTLDVTEHLYDEAGHRWTHVSEWYWAATVGGSPGPWWSLTTIRTGR